MADTDFLFVYGTLKKGFQNETASYLHSTQEFAGSGFFYGVMVRISYYPGAVYLPEKESKVHGHLFRIRDQKEDLFARLDFYEGVGDQFAKPGEFIRSVVPVFMDEKKIPAYTYLLNKDHRVFQQIESGHFTST